VLEIEKKHSNLSSIKKNLKGDLMAKSKVIIGNKKNVAAKGGSQVLGPRGNRYLYRHISKLKLMNLKYDTKSTVIKEK